MKKIIKLSESDLVKIIKNVINEQSLPEKISKIWLTNLSINGESSTAGFKIKLGEQINTFKKVKCSNGSEINCFNLPGLPGEIPNGNYGPTRFPRNIIDYGVKLYHNSSSYICNGPVDTKDGGLPCKKV